MSIASPSLPDQPEIVCAIRLPSENHKLYCWKVLGGSSVRSGETVALAKLRVDTPQSDDGSSSATAAAANTKAPTTEASPQYRRATRRRKPGAIVLDTATSTEASDAGRPPDSESGKEKIEAHSAASTLVKGKAINHNLVPIVAQGDGIVRMGPLNCNQQRTTDALVIGYIEKCKHSTIIEGLCAVCGEPVEEPSNNGEEAVASLSSSSLDLKSPPPNMSHVTVGGLTVAISEVEGQRMAQQDAERLRHQRKLSLVLDLDHTLVHATNDIRAHQHLRRSDVRSLVLPVMGQPFLPQLHHQQMWMQHFVKLRPFLKEFLETALELFEVGVYTAGTRDYAEQITIMLARHLVGAPYDHQIDLDALRHQVTMAVAELERTRPRVGKEEKKVESSTPEQGAMEQETEQTNGEASNGVAASKIAGTKRKRVTFGDVPASEKTDQITEEDVAKLQSMLDEAERLEAKAQEMRQRLFGSRVVSRTDVGDLGRDVKSLKRIFPCGGTMAVVVDDREDVWANADDVTLTRRGEPPENLLLVRPYHWRPFLGFADVNNAAGTDFSEAGIAEQEELEQNKEETDEQLRWTCDVLKRLHQKFYAKGEHSDTTVADILRGMRHEVLSGGSVLLSGLVPLHKQNQGPDVPRPSVIRYVESLGATVLTNVTGSVTHVVGAKDGTDKIMNARKVPGCFIVKPSWLMECVWTLTRRDERKHLLGPPPGSSQVRPLGSSRAENASSNSDDDEDDDDLAAQFENDFMEDGLNHRMPS